MVFEKRQAGVLLPVFSLPSKYGIGTFGKEAYKFIDNLKKAKQSYWQVLPHGPTGYADSPYQSYSSFAGNPYFIDLELLQEKNLITKEECDNFIWFTDENYIDYDKVSEGRAILLRKAFERDNYIEILEYKNFIKENSYWINDYALFMALRDENDKKSWHLWKTSEKMREEKAIKDAEKRLEKEINYYIYVQYLFFSQWSALKKYANENGIQIIGDIPIYLSLESSDVWANRRLFELNSDGEPKRVAGCPPDEFAKTGQLWGNPLYLWNVHKKDKFKWWISRMRAIFNMYDVVRIDHFRGFEKFYSIPADAETAENGEWVNGPGIELFNTIKSELGDVKIIAEDLGYITPEVRKLLNDTGYPGMKVMQFAFKKGVNSEYLLHNHIKNCVVYTGTHDNQTSKSWFEGMSWEERNYTGQYMGFYTEEWDKNRFIRHTMSSTANLVIVPLQDYLELGDEARINTPSTVENNWQWRLKQNQFDDECCRYMAYIANLYYRDK